MAVPTVAEIVVDVAVPGGATISMVLNLIRELVTRIRYGQTTFIELHRCLHCLFEELQRIELSGGLQRKAVDKFLRMLEEYWRHLEGEVEVKGRLYYGLIQLAFRFTSPGYPGHLEAYNAMNIVERLLFHPKMYKAIASINTNVDELFSMVGIVTPRLTADWRKQYEADMAEEHYKLIEITKSVSDVRRDLRDKHERVDTVVLLKDALQKVECRELTLPHDVQDAFRRTLKAITFDTRLLDGVMPPEWFINESEVDFDEVPFARGWFATVHRGKYHEHTPVAVKMLLPGKGGLDSTLQTAFAKEVSIWSRFHHPHVARLLGACHVSSRPYLVCDDASNVTMSEFLDRCADRQVVMWRLLYEAAQGLSYLHSKCVVHGDIRLANILVTQTGTALLAGFGLSRVKFIAMTARKVTWRWMAPECSAYMPRFESDVYSLAMCILEAFGGHPPYVGVSDEQEVKDKVLVGELPRRPAGLTDNVWSLIERMTTMDWKKRIPLPEVIQILGELANSELAPFIREDESDH